MREPIRKPLDKLDRCESFVRRSAAGNGIESAKSPAGTLRHAHSGFSFASNFRAARLNS